MISTRANNISPSLTIGLSSKVASLKSSGVDVLDLSIGEPDFNIPEKAKQIGIESLLNNKTKYDLVNGLSILREEIRNKLLIENNCNYSIDEIVVSSGAKNALTNALLAITNPGNDILIPKPYWVSYTEMIKLVHCNPILVDTYKENNFKVTVSNLENYISSNTKAIIINNPSNPTGSIYSKDELLDIVNFCIKNNIYIIADEIYERICFEDTFTSIASMSSLAKDITITINGFSKSCAMTGLRIGYSASNNEIAKAIKNMQGHLISHPSLVSQYIAYGALKYCKDDIDHMVSVYKNRRDLVCNKLNEIRDINYIYPHGAFYAFLDLSRFKSKFNYKESFSMEFCSYLLDKYKVAIVPGLAFGLDDWVRISFACSEETLLAGLNKLNEFIKNV